MNTVECVRLLTNTWLAFDHIRSQTRAFSLGIMGHGASQAAHRPTSAFKEAAHRRAPFGPDTPSSSAGLRLSWPRTSRPPNPLVACFDGLLLSNVRFPLDALSSASSADRYDVYGHGENGLCLHLQDSIDTDEHAPISTPRRHDLREDQSARKMGGECFPVEIDMTRHVPDLQKQCQRTFDEGCGERSTKLRRQVLVPYLPDIYSGLCPAEKTARLWCVVFRKTLQGQDCIYNGVCPEYTPQPRITYLQNDFGIPCPLHPPRFRP